MTSQAVSSWPAPRLTLELESGNQSPIRKAACSNHVRERGPGWLPSALSPALASSPIQAECTDDQPTGAVDEMQGELRGELRGELWRHHERLTSHFEAKLSLHESLLEQILARVPRRPKASTFANGSPSSRGQTSVWRIGSGRSSHISSDTFAGMKSVSQNLPAEANHSLKSSGRIAVITAGIKLADRKEGTKARDTDSCNGSMEFGRIAAMKPPAERIIPSKRVHMNDYKKRASALRVADELQLVSAARRSLLPLEAQGCLSRVVKSIYFELFFAVAIISNSALIGVECNARAVVLGESHHLGFMIAGQLYTVLFLVELLLRLAVHRHHLFCQPGWVWACLDVFIVVTSLMESTMEWLHLLGQQQVEEGMSGISNVRVMRLVRITRLMRIFRITRVVRFIRALKTLVFSIVATLKSLVWALLLMMMITYVFGIVFTQASTEVMHGAIADHDISAEDLLQLRLYWGTLDTSMYSLFRSMSNGLSWDVVADPLTSLGIGYQWLFLIFISFSQFAVLNVITGVFCHSAIEAAQHDQDTMVQVHIRSREEYIQKLQSLFTAIDEDLHDCINLSAFERSLEKKEVRALFEILELHPTDAWTLFKLLDTESSHLVKIEDFIDGCLRLRGTAKAIDLMQVLQEQRAFSRALLECLQALDGRLLDMECGGLPDADFDNNIAEPDELDVGKICSVAA